MARSLDAALVGLERTETTTAPSIQDEAEVTKYFDAAAALLAASQTGKPAPRSRLGDKELTEITLRNERDQQRIESLHGINCDLLMTNGMLRRQLAVEQTSVE